MYFGGGGAPLYQEFVDKYKLVPGFGGLLDLKNLFGELMDETSFARDRVSLQVLKS